MSLRVRPEARARAHMTIDLRSSWARSSITFVLAFMLTVKGCHAPLILASFLELTPTHTRLYSYSYSFSVLDPVLAHTQARSLSIAGFAPRLHWHCGFATTTFCKRSGSTKPDTLMIWPAVANGSCAAISSLGFRCSAFAFGRGVWHGEGCGGASCRRRGIHASAQVLETRMLCPILEATSLNPSP